MKVIFINTFTSYHVDHSMYRPGSDAFYQFGMGVFIAQEFLKRNYAISFEIWRADKRIMQVMEKTVEGVKCRIFPSTKTRVFEDYSNLMVRALIKESGSNDTIFHFMGVHKLEYHYYSFFLKKAKVIATHLGGANPLWKFQQSRKKILSYLYYLAERNLILKNYNHFITISKLESEYFQHSHRSVSLMPIFGLSREHVFDIRNRRECRLKLGLPLSKPIILQVGRATRNRGFEWIIDIIDNPDYLEKYHFEFVGIDPSNEYYDALVARGFQPIQYSKQEVLADYYNSADVLIFLPLDELDIHFAGTGYVPLESLACGTPVISTTFNSFPDKLVENVSKNPKSKEEIIPLIDELLSSNIDRQLCRDIVLNSFSWDEVVKKHFQLYSSTSYNYSKLP